MTQSEGQPTEDAAAPGPANATLAAKRAIRRTVRASRTARSEAQRLADDAARFALLRNELIVRMPRRLACYLSAGPEPDTLELVDWAYEAGIEVLLPVLSDGTGNWLPSPAWALYAGPDRLRIGYAGIAEPDTPLAVAPSPSVKNPLSEVDLMLLPGLAADLAGNRLGRGGGWYDRARADVPELETWLLLNADEIVDQVPVESWDLSVTRVFTAAQAIWTRNR